MGRRAEDSPVARFAQAVGPSKSLKQQLSAAEAYAEAVSVRKHLTPAMYVFSEDSAAYAFAAYLTRDLV